MATRYLEAAADFPGSTSDAAKNVREVYVDTDNEIVKVYDKTNSVWKGIGDAFARSVTASLTPALEDFSRPLILNAAAGLTITLPTATGSGAKLRVEIGTTLTSNSYIFSCGGSDTFYGGVFVSDTGASANPGGDHFPASGGSSVTLTLAFATGMGVIGDVVEFVDVGALKWAVRGFVTSTAADPSTPWS